MNTEDTMPRVSISMSKQELKTLEDLSKQEDRNKSKQIVHMMKQYLRSKKE